MTSSGRQGTGSIWQDTLDCHGYEADLASCSHPGWDHNNNCTHENDVSVTCSGEFLETSLP